MSTSYTQILSDQKDIHGSSFHLAGGRVNFYGFCNEGGGGIRARLYRGNSIVGEDLYIAAGQKTGIIFHVDEGIYWIKILQDHPDEPSSGACSVDLI